MDNDRLPIKEIFDTARGLLSTLDVDALLRRVGSVAERLLNAETSSVMLLDDDKANLSFKLTTGEKGGVVQKVKVKIGQGIAGTVASERQSIIVNDVTKEPHFLGQADGSAARSLIGAPLLIENELIGVVEVRDKKGGDFSEDDRILLESLAALAAVSISNARIAEDQRNFFANTIEIIVSAIEAADPKLSGHCWNVAQLATAIGRHLDMDEKDFKNLYYGALLHDIGFINSKSGLSLVEGVMTMRDRDPEINHPKSGAEMVRNINLLKGAAPVIRHHHENYDGTGYPDGLAGEAIPLGARIVAVAEIVEEMRLNGIPEDRIRQIVKMGQETRFDPQIVGIYLKEA